MGCKTVRPVVKGNKNNADALVLLCYNLLLSYGKMHAIAQKKFCKQKSKRH